MAKAFAAFDNPKRISAGYLYHWWLVDGSFDRTFTDRNLLSRDEQKNRFNELRKSGGGVSRISRNTPRDPDDMSRWRYDEIQMKPWLKDDDEWWGTSEAELRAVDDYDDL